MMVNAVVILFVLSLTHPESVLELNGKVLASDIGQFGVSDGAIVLKKGKSWQKLAGGLVDPKGIAALNDSTIVVTDVTVVRQVTLSGKTKVLFGESDFRDKKPEFLNDITLGPDGRVYFSDTRKNCIFVGNPESGKVNLLVKVNSPNGVVFGPDSTLYIITFEKPGKVYSYKDGSLRLVFKSHDIDGGDGIVVTPNGKLIMSGFISGKIVEYDIKTGNHRVLKKGLKTPADISLSVSSTKLYIPLLQEGKVIEMPVSH